MNPTTHSEGGFSLVAGGPGYRLQVWLGLIKPDSPGFAKRVALSIVLTWVVLLVVSALEGRALGHDVGLPFLHDFHGYSMYLVALPLLILAEAVIERQLPGVADQFVRCDLVTGADVEVYNAALARAARWRDSSLVEGALLGVTAVTVVIASREFPFDFSSWRSLVSGSVHTRTVAGWWDLVVGRGLVQFLCWRWLWRLFIWYGFLWRMSKLDLHLIPTHPDRAAGLGFVGDGQRLFWVIVVAISAGIAGGIADEVVFVGVPLKSYAFGIGGFVMLVLLFFLWPLLMFTPRMIQAKIKSVREYSALAVAHHRAFDQKWVQGADPRKDSLLGAPEISSLADLGGAYEILAKMRPLPFVPSDTLALVMASLLPMAPLLLTVYPLDELLRLLWKLVI